MLAWQTVDTREDPDQPRFTGDPGDLIDAYAELARLLERPAWHAQAACRGQRGYQWFPTRGEDTRPAKAVCATCPVSDTCLAAGMTEPGGGIWGGTSERERRRLRRGHLAA